MFWRKLTKSVDEERGTEPEEEYLLCTPWIAQRRQADLINTSRFFFEGREEAAAHDPVMCAF